MKLHLPSRLVQALITTCAAALTCGSPVFAAVPEGYEPVTITDVDQLADYTESDYIAFIISSDITNSAYRMTGAHQYWTDSIRRTHALTFSESESKLLDGAMYINAELVAEHLQEISFSCNAFSSDSPVIYADNSTITFNDNGSVMFSDNYTAGYNSVIRCDNGLLNLTGNEAVSFCGNSNSSCFASAIAYVCDYPELPGTFLLKDNGSVTFSGNSASDGGSAIYIENGLLIVTGNGSVTFSDNSGGAIWGSKYIEFSSNESVTFSDNSAGDGGAINLEYNLLNVKDNGSVTFSGNSAGYGGGAINAYNSFDLSGTLNVTGNGSVTFSGNSAWCGGAIYTEGTLNVTDNGSVKFSDNSAKYGGAIFSYALLNVTGNDSVTFSGNYEQRGSGSSATYRLRSVYMTDSVYLPGGITLKLAAGEGQAITFYDTLYAKAVSGTLTVSYNARYQDGEGVTRDATGDIVFSGARAAEDLKALKANYTKDELTNSLTTEVYATTNLYGGRLRIEDGAIYKGNGINVAAGSNATLRLMSGTLEQTGYDVLLHAGSTLDLEGANSITASTLEMMDGSTLSFNAGATEGVMLNLDAALKTGDLHVTVSGDLTKEYALLQLADVSQYDFTQWNSGQVNVTGTDFEHLIWKDGMLTYKPWESTHTDLDKDTEVDDFGGEEGVEIGGHGHSLTVKHPVDLVQLAMKNGVVRLEGADNNVVRITLTEDGTLQLAAGAGLKMGNIVSMVANGSADLEISGDIEISDIKAYGKPGNKGTLSYVNMTTAGDYTIENMTITGSVIDVGEGTTLYLVNVDIKSDTHITDAPARVFAQRAHVELNGINTWVDQEITAAQDTLLYMCGDTQRSITLAAGSEIVELTSSMFDSVTLTGTDLWLDMTGIAEATYGKDYFTLDFQDFAREMAKAQVDVENLHVYATLDGERYTEAYSTANGGLTTKLYFQVPEPATGTLSLLALAALAARRRRKIV